MKMGAKTLLSSLLCGFLASVAYADWLVESQVRAAAEAFPARDDVGAGVLSGRTLRDLAPRDALWIARYDPSGYAVFSGSDLVGPVVAFSDNDYVEPSEGEAFYDVLKGASGGCREAEAAGETSDGLLRRAKWQKLLVTPKVKALLKGSSTSGTNVSSVEPFMTTRWNQCQPFNDFAPVYGAAASSDTYRGRCPCGCIATAAAQVFRYWNWPARIDTVSSCIHKFVDSSWNVNDYSVRFDGNVPFDWGMIADVYRNRGIGGSDMRGTLPESARYHVARLVQMCGLLGNMVFEPDASSSSFDTLIPNAPWYASGTKYSLGRTGGESYERAVAALKADIVAKRPVMASLPGHAVVAHGWREGADSRYVYLDFGWGESSSDAYYNLDDRTSENRVEDIYVGFMPKMMAQLDPLPAVSPETVRLSWHIPEVWANSGLITGCQVVAYSTSDNLADWRDDFSSAEGATTSSLLGIDSASGALCAWPLASGTYTWGGKMLLTTRSVLTYSLNSEYALGHTLTVEAKFDDGDWTVVSAPSLNLTSSSSAWKMERVFLGTHGGEMAQFRVKVSFPGGSYYSGSDPVLAIDDFKVTDVFAQTVTRRRCAVGDLSATIDGCREGSRCSFAVELSSTDGAVVTSEPVSTMIEGMAMMPRPGNEVYSYKNLVFATVGAEDVWAYEGNVVSSDGVSDHFNPYAGYVCSVSAQIHGSLTGISMLSFGFRSANYYSDGSYDTITTTFTDESGNSTVVETLTRRTQHGTEWNNVALGQFAGRSGTVTVNLKHTAISGVLEGTCVIEGVQVLNVEVPELPAYAYMLKTFSAAEMPAINNVAHTKSAVVDGMFAECSMGGNVFQVECTPGVVSLEAHVSAASYIPDSAVTVRKRGNGMFVVEVDASGIPASAERTRAIMTLAATDANGSTAYKDVSLRFSSETEGDVADPIDDPIDGPGDDPYTQPLPVSTETFGNYTWSYVLNEDGSAAIFNNGSTAVFPSPSGSLSIPSYLGGHPVTAIGGYAFRSCSALTSIALPKGVSSIGEGAFYATALSTVYIAQGDSEDRARRLVAASGYNVGGVSFKPKTTSAVYVSVLSGQEGLGKVSGGGTALKIGSKTTLKGVPAGKDWVFAGWLDAKGETVSRAASLAYTVTDEDVSFKARFATVAEDAASLALAIADQKTAADGSVTIDVGAAAAESLSEPKFAVKGLPTGLKYDAKTLMITGKATKPGVYTVKVEATNVSVKKATAESTAEFTITVPNFVDDAIKIGDEYGPFIPGVVIEPLTIAAAVGCKVSGLPAGLAWTDKDVTDKKTGAFTPANSAYGAATKPGNYTVYFTKTTADKVKHTATATFVVGPLLNLKVVAAGEGKGKVTGAGAYAANKKVSLKATAEKESVFMGWYDVDGNVISQSASISYEMPARDVELTAKFITSAQDAAGVAAVLDVPGYNPRKLSASDSLSLRVPCGVYLEWPLGVSALSLPATKVSGLPAGLKFTDKNIMKKGSKTEVDIPANTIYGTPSAASKVDKKTNAMIPSAVKVAVTTAGKTKVDYTIYITVDPIADWAVGNFDGGFDVGQATLAIAAGGKISGKIISDGLTYALSATDFASFDEPLGRYSANVTAKAGKEVSELALVIMKPEAGEAGGNAVLYDADGREVARLGQTNWNAEPWKTVGKTLPKEYVYPVSADSFGYAGEMSLKFASSGKVTTKGVFTMGRDERTGKDITYSASGSAVLIPMTSPSATGAFKAKIYVYLPTKTGKFPGYCGCIILYFGMD